MKDLAKNISRALKQESCDFVLIGAFARDIFFEQKGIPLEYATKDVDFAVLTESWEKFGQIKDKLIKELKLEPTEKIYRLLYHSVPVDLLPFGKIVEPGNTIKWPSGFRERMNIMGFREAYENGQEIDVDGELIRTIIPEMLLALKFSSWSHGANRSKDAIDIINILKNAEGLCGDLMTNDKLEISEEAQYQSRKEKVIVRIGYQLTLLLKPETLSYIQTLTNSDFNKVKLFREANLGKDVSAELHEELMKLLRPFLTGINKKI